MSEEQKPPVGDNPEAGEPTPIDPANPPEPIKELHEKSIREIRAATVPPQEMPGAAGDLRKAETPEATDTRRKVEDALNKPVEAIEDAVNALDRATSPHTPEEALAEHYPNKTVILGRTIPLPLYTVVFISLAIFTLIEVVVGMAPHTPLTIPTLLVIAVVKALHVVLYYMHLRTDSRIFALTLLIPIVLVTLALIFLLAVPPQAY